MKPFCPSWRSYLWHPKRVKILKNELKNEFQTNEKCLNKKITTPTYLYFWIRPKNNKFHKKLKRGFLKPCLLLDWSSSNSWSPPRWHTSSQKVMGQENRWPSVENMIGRWELMKIAKDKWENDNPFYLFILTMTGNFNHFKSNVGNLHGMLTIRLSHWQIINNYINNQKIELQNSKKMYKYLIPSSRQGKYRNMHVYQAYIYKNIKTPFWMPHY